MGNIIITPEIEQKYAPDALIEPQVEGFTDELWDQLDEELEKRIKAKGLEGKVTKGFHVDYEAHWDYVKFFLEFKQRHNLPI